MKPQDFINSHFNTLTDKGNVNEYVVNDIAKLANTVRDIALRDGNLQIIRHDGSVQTVKVEQFTPVLLDFISNPHFIAGGFSKNYKPKNTGSQKVLPGHVLASEQYLSQCIALLPVRPLPSMQVVIDILQSVDLAKVEKAKLVGVVQDAIAYMTPTEYGYLNLTPEQQTTYNTLCAKEQNIRQAREELAKYLEADSIKVISDTRIEGMVLEPISTGQNPDLMVEFTKLLAEEYAGFSTKAVLPIVEGFTVKQRGGVIAIIELKPVN